MGIYDRDDRYGRGNRFGEPRDPRGNDYRGRDDDRGFFERGADEVRSWFGDNDAESRRQRDGDGYHFDPRMDRYGNRDTGYRGYDRGATSASDDYGRTRYGGDRSHGSGNLYERPDYGPVESRPSFGARSPSHHDDDYRSWRDRQMQSYDRDYEEYRRERQDRFHTDFDSWRTSRPGQTQQSAAANGTQWSTKIREHQEVLGSDGGHVGTVDHVDGERLKLTKRDGDGQHHYIPLTSIVSVDNAVRLNVSADDAKRQWRTETATRK